MPAQAAKWDLKENVTLSEAYTDNVYLSETNPESSWATIISPNVILSGKGRKMSLELVGAFQFISNAEKKFYPRLRGQLNSELYERRLFLSAWIYADQEAIDPLKASGSPINRTGNLTTTYAIGINPYWVEHFGDLADLRADYEYSHRFYTTGSLGDENRNNFFLKINDGRRFSVSNWGLDASYKKTTYQKDSSADTVFKSLDLRLGYDVTRSLSPYVTFGREWNTYNTSQARRGGNKWLVGAIWSPNPRLRLNLGYGYRFFGHYPFVDLRYRRRRSVLSLNYRRDLESGYVPLEFQSFLATTNPLGNPVNPFGGNPGGISGTQGFNSLARIGAFVDERFTGSYLFQGRRTTFGINGRYSDKDYQLQPKRIIEWQLGMNVVRNVSRNIIVDAWTRWDRIEDETDFQADTWYLGLGITRQLGTYTHLRLGYIYSNRDSNRINDSYIENRFALILNTSMVRLAKQAGWY